ncbi:MAG: hypothetical protein WDM94_12765 [Bauldia sp.]
MIRFQICGGRVARPDEPDFFETETQQELFGPDATPVYQPDPDKVRARLHKIIGEARTAKTLPWEPTRLSLYRAIVPQMTLWLPDDEGAQLRFEFETEIARLKAA